MVPPTHRDSVTYPAGTSKHVNFLLEHIKNKTAVNWLSPLVGEWMDRLRQYHKVGDTAALPGAKVVALICAHISRVFTVRRKVLRDNVEYWARSRDPVASL